MNKIAWVNLIDGVLHRYTFEDADIKEARSMSDISLSGRSLDADSLTATVRSTDPTITQFDPLRPIVVSRGGSRIGTYYMKAVTRLGVDLVKLEMVSPLGKLEQLEHTGGIYDNERADDIIYSICHYDPQNPNAGGVAVIIEEPFASTLVSGWLPYVSPSAEAGASNGSAKDNLLQVLFAINATVRADANGKLRIENLSQSASSAPLTADRIFASGYEIKHGQAYSDIALTEHTFAANGGDAEELFSGDAGNGQKVIFQHPIDTESFTVTGSLQVDATEYNENYAVLTGYGTLTGIPYLHIQRTINGTVTSGASPHTVTITDATLITSSNSTTVLQRLIEYYKHTITIDAEASLLFERTGDVVNIFDRYANALVSATIESISPADFSQTLRGSVSALVGYLPWQQYKMKAVRETLKTAQTWEVPEGVYEISVLIVGGGSGGSAGGAGQDAGVAESYVVDYPQRGGILWYVLTPIPQMTEGGAAGVAGRGGKILRVVLSVQPGDTFAVTIGAGGAGAAAGSGASGNAGGASTFGAYSSAEGAYYDGGWFDPVTSAYLAKLGNDGYAGGAGGGLNKQSTLAEDYIESGDVEVDGTVYHGGARAEDAVFVEAHGGTYPWDVRVNYVGAGGGGAAYGANGNDGEPCLATDWNVSPYFGPTSGGDGADAQAPATPTVYGQGGAGGNGGGGAGATGYFIFNKYGSGAPVHPNGADILLGIPAHGGAGSAGGAGANGVVLIDYQAPDET